MKISIGLAGGLVLLVSACAEYSGTDANGHITKLSDQVLAIAEPTQDLSAVRINPHDGCYEYRYQGPVETMYIPLRTTEGRPICSREQET